MMGFTEHMARLWQSQEALKVAFAQQDAALLSAALTAREIPPAFGVTLGLADAIRLCRPPLAQTFDRWIVSVLDTSHRQHLLTRALDWEVSRFDFHRSFKAAVYLARRAPDLVLELSSQSPASSAVAQVRSFLVLPRTRLRFHTAFLDPVALLGADPTTIRLPRLR